VPNLIKIDSAVVALRMREKHDIAWVFLLTLSRPTYLFFATPTGRIFSATLNGSYDMLLQPLVPVWGRVKITPI